MTVSEGDDSSRHVLPEEVVERVVAVLSDRGEKTVAALRTAAELIRLAVHDDRRLRFAESAAYNLREALEAVVAGKPPVPGGQYAVIDAWKQLEEKIAQPGADSARSLKAFLDVVRQAADRKDHRSFHEAQLLGDLRDKSGVDPLAGDLDPVAEYGRLRGTANRGLHRATTLDDVTELYHQTIAWFVRMFTPPDTVVLALRDLAAEPWQGQEQIDRLRKLPSNPHHLKVFFTYLSDPGWLPHLHDANVVPLPVPGTPWPVAGMLQGLGQTHPGEVAALTQRLLAECQDLPGEKQLDARFDLLSLATQLGTEGHTIVGDIATAHPGNRAVRALACGVVKRTDPAAPIVSRVADIMLNNEPTDRDSYYYRLLLDQMEAGMSSDNAAQRTAMVAAKVRRAAQHDRAGWIVFGIARLTTKLDDEDRQFLVVAIHYLARLLIRAHTLGVPGRQLLGWIDKIPGDVGERLVCQLLAHARDLPLQEKIDHITRRLASEVATGDDKDLVDAVLASGPDRSQLVVWAEALGTPSGPPADTAALPQDWARAWRWSAVLPEYLLEDWTAPIAAVSDRHGPAASASFAQRIPSVVVTWGKSAYSKDELASLPVLEAAERVSTWRPDAESDRRSVGARELARTLQSVVVDDPAAWTAAPATIVEALREPVYVLHYFRALAENPKGVLPRTREVIAAARLVKAANWAPAVLGNDTFDFEPNWRHVDTAIVDLITKLADHDALFEEDTDTVWGWAQAAVESSPELNTSMLNAPLDRAINNPRGRGLQAVLALAAWELRNLGAIRAEFSEGLDTLLAEPRPDVAMEFRAILASQRLRLERVAGDWLDRRVDALFRGDLGPSSVDITLNHGRYTTPWLYRNLREEIIAAALRGTDNAVPSLLIGTLKGEAGYDVGAIIAALRKDPKALAKAAASMATLVQESAADAGELETAIRFWQALIDADRRTVPGEVLLGTGRWSFVAGIPESAWASITLQTLGITGGLIDFAIEVADRCEHAPIPGDSTKILLLLQGRGENWEQHHVAHAALGALRTLSTSRADENFLALRTRLIELGHDDAAFIQPYEDRS